MCVHVLISIKLCFRTGTSIFLDAKSKACSLILSKITTALHPAPSTFHKSLASTEQCRKDGSSSTQAITRTPAAEVTALVAGGAAHLLQAGLADIQDFEQSAHLGISGHAAALGHCGHQPLHFSMCRSDALTLANDPSAAQRLQLGTLCLCLLLSSTVILPLYLN